MGLFDIFNTNDQQAAANSQIAGLNAGYGQLSNIVGNANNNVANSVASSTSPFLTNLKQGQAGQTAYANATGANGAAGTQQAIQNFQASPGYQFSVDQAMQNILRGQEATGQAASGATNMDINQQVQGLANQQWQNYIQNLSPFLNTSNAAAQGNAAATMQGAGLTNQNNLTQANAAYGTQAGIGNANAAANLAGLNASANMWNLAGSALSGLTGAIGMFADGGDTDAGQPIIVGEHGPELIVPRQDSTVIPNHKLPRGYMNPSTQAIGKILAPNLTDYLNSSASNDPQPRTLPNGKISSYDPRMGGVASDVGNLATLPLALAGAPEMLGARAAESMAPAGADAAASAARGMGRQINDIASGVGGGSYALSPTPANAGQGQRPTILPEEQQQIDQLNLKIQNLTAARQKAAGKPGQVGPKAASLATAPYDQQISALNGQIQQINGQVASRQNAWDTQQEEARSAQAPLAVRNPNIVNAARAGAMLTSPALGTFMAYKGIRPAKIALAGLAEGLAPNLGTNIMDYATGGEARQSAVENIKDPYWWGQAIGGESALAGILASTGGHFGEALRAPGPSRGAPPVNAGSRARVPAPAGQSVAATAAANAAVFQDGAVWRERGTGRFAKAPAQSRPGSP